MHTHKLTLLLTATLGTLLTLNPATAEEAKTVKFEPTVKSLQQYECPDWFRDAKFGIYLHWGAYSVAEQGEWYARNLYIENRPDYQHHLSRSYSWLNTANQSDTKGPQGRRSL